mgnify:CR=1 FL=1
MAGRDGGSGYFGKLPARADFVIGACPGGFLRLWEPFLIGGLAQSRLDLKDAWEEAYMTMPVWRFWLKPSGNGGGLATAVAGAFMPSVDRVGRQFPLTVVAPFGAGDERDEPAEDWYDDVEAVLLKALAEDAELSDFQEAVAGLAPPEPGGNAGRYAQAPELAVMEGTSTVAGAGLHCRAGDGGYAFRCSGLPHPLAFRWLILPETYGAAGDRREGTGQPENGQEEAGTSCGLYDPEDNRT